MDAVAHDQWKVRCDYCKATYDSIGECPCGNSKWLYNVETRAGMFKNLSITPPEHMAADEEDPIYERFGAYTRTLALH